jgi:hypothetical protein
MENIAGATMASAIAIVLVLPAFVEWNRRHRLRRIRRMARVRAFVNRAEDTDRSDIHLRG